MKLFAIKLTHTLIFLFLSGCILYTIYCGIKGITNTALWLAMFATVIEVVVYIGNGARCPLTRLAQKYGDVRGDDFIADIFLPEWFVPFIVPLCTVLAVGGFLSVGFQLLSS